MNKIIFSFCLALCLLVIPAFLGAAEVAQPNRPIICLANQGAGAGIENQPVLNKLVSTKKKAITLHILLGTKNQKNEEREVDFSCLVSELIALAGASVGTVQLKVGDAWRRLPLDKTLEEVDLGMGGMPEIQVCEAISG